jgi:hypothetical protein
LKNIELKGQNAKELEKDCEALKNRCAHLEAVLPLDNKVCA